LFDEAERSSVGGVVDVLEARVTMIRAPPR
jgi:hypothetical protein